MPPDENLEALASAGRSGSGPSAFKEPREAPFESTSFDRKVFENRVRVLSAAAVARYEGFCLSPAYYELTGRRGLWLATDADCATVYCRHPNIEREFLVFPEIGENVSYDLTLGCVDALRRDGSVVRLARFTARQADAIRKQAVSFEINEVSEDVLDWRHPVRILDVTDVIDRRGGRYEQLRQRLNKIDAGDIMVDDLDTARDREPVERLAESWAGESRKRPFSPRDLLSPLARLLDMAATPQSRVVGQVLRRGPRLIGCSIWEQPLLNGLAANQLAAVCDTSVQGLSEFQVVAMCARIAQAGVQTVNLGGSETHGLDRFKRKFSPVDSIHLLSLAVNGRRARLS